MSSIWVPLLLSLKVAGWATVLASVAGVALAYGLSRSGSRWGDVADSLLTLPMVLPPTVIGYYLLVLFGRRGWLGGWLQAHGVELVFTWQGAAVAASVVAFPMVLKASRASFLEVDHRLEQAAAVLGAGRLSVFLLISLPLAARGIMAGVLLAFARALGEFGATLMVAGSIPGRTETLSIAIFEAVQSGDDAMANVLVGVTSAVCVAVLCLVAWLLRRGQSHRVFRSF
ncbi:MAG TPA: molybdate ABC transporter permease subunit [Castellaniella sp.]|uniref:molybdate ABC transporter permease subunit n=1 Tax=Castellaniella sp. TaxID=1955812 RepID=UPI002F0B04AB